MKLNFKKFGTGQPLIILHGLFGSLDNWQTLGKQFAENFTVFLVDQRNHGQSPHSKEWNYEVMVDDLMELMKDENIENPIVIGHSMGGKTAMLFAVRNPGILRKLIVADMAPKYYEPHHQQIIQALTAVDFDKVKSRKEVEEILFKYIKDLGTMQFLLKNIYWEDLENKILGWRFNLEVISENIKTVGMAIPENKPAEHLPALFIRGGKSDYIQDKDKESIKKIFPLAEIKTIENAGHWVHAEAPAEFYNMVIQFIAY